MIDDDLRKLRLDRRLVDRRGWISLEEFDRELAALPDVSQKVAPEEPAAAGEATPAASDGSR